MNKVYRKIFLVSALLTTSLITSIRVLYMFEYHTSAGQVAVLKGIFSVIVAVTELPTGIIADKVSKKMSLAIGAVLFAIHSLVYVVFPNYLGFVATQVLLALSSSFISGADDGYLDDYITENTQDDYVDIAGKMEYWGGYVKATLFLASGYLYHINNKLNFLLTCGFGVLAFIAVCMLPKTSEKNVTNEKGANKIQEYVSDTLGVLKHIFTNRFIFGVTMLSAVVMSLLIFNFEYYQIILSKLGFPSQYNGLLYASFMILGGIGAKLSKRMLDRMGVHGLFTLFIILIVASYIAFALSQGWPFILAAIVVQQIAFGSWGLVIKNIMFKNLPSQSVKSTMISMNSLVTNFIKGSIVIALGYVLEYTTHAFVYEFMAAIMIVLLFMEIFSVAEEGK